MKKKKKNSSYQKRQNIYGYLFMSPWILGFALFTAVPFVATIYFSFSLIRQTILGFQITWSGLDNYYTALLKNTKFTPAILGYLSMIIPYTFVVIVLSFILAYLLSRVTVLRGFMRTVYFLPVIIMSGPVMAQILNKNSIGDQYEAMMSFNDIFIIRMVYQYSHQLAHTVVGVFMQLSMILWFTGIPIILYINGLQKINPSLYEAAQIDSANSWQILWKITIPIIKPIVLVVTIFTIINIGTFAINPVYGLIKDATANTSGGLGLASAYALMYSLTVLFLIGLVFLLLRNKKEKRRNHYR